MTRSMDLVRELLFRIEACPSQRGKVDLQVPDFSEEEVHYHLGLLSQARLIEAHDVSSSEGIHFIPSSLTWEGHEFLDAARNDTIWNQAKSEVKKSAVSVPLEVMKKVLLGLLSKVIPI